MSDRQPIFNVPTVVIWVVGAFLALHLFRQTLSPDSDIWLVLSLAFIPARYAGYAAELPGGELAAVTSPVTHMLVHGDLTHLVFNSAWMLAFGGAVAQRVGAVRFLVAALVSGLAGALLFLVANFGALMPVVGASGAISGLMGATMRFLFSAMDSGGMWLLRTDPQSVRLMPLTVALRDRRIVTTTAIWVAINLLAIIGFAGVPTEAGIAWEAHLGGYFAGLLAFGLIDAPAPRHSPG